MDSFTDCVFCDRIFLRVVRAMAGSTSRTGSCTACQDTMGSCSASVSRHIIGTAYFFVRGRSSRGHCLDINIVSSSSEVNGLEIGGTAHGASLQASIFKLQGVSETGYQALDALSQLDKALVRARERHRLWLRPS